MSEHIEVAALERLVRMSGSELALELLNRFLSEAPGRLAESQAALERGDFHLIEHHLHRVSSDSAWLGAKAMQTLASEGEMLALERRMESLQRILTSLVNLCPDVCKAMEELRPRLEAGDL